MPTFGINCNRNTRRPETGPTALKILSWGERSGHTVLLSESAAQLAGADASACSDAELRERIEVLISLGGDGTMLNSARLTAGTEIPILGVHLGTLGFLAETPLVELEDDLEKIAVGDYRLDERMTLQARYQGFEIPPALNDVVVDRGATSRIIEVDLFANNEPIASYQADGMIFATPTGSTAYSLSVGGPILAPSMHAIIASPISAFGFNGRPFVFNEDTEIEVRVFSQHGKSALTIDGQFTIEFPESAEFRVSKGSHTVRLIRFHDSSFYQALRQKLNWGTPPSLDGE